MSIRLSVSSVALLALLPIALPSVWAQALPVGAHVTAGTAILVTNGNKLTVTNTPAANINWQSFNIGAGNTTQFVQQNSASMVLNSVSGVSPPNILGNLVSNEKVFLVNPNGAVPSGTGTRLPFNAAAFQSISGSGINSIGILTPSPGAATRAVVGADGTVRLTSAP